RAADPVLPLSFFKNRTFLLATGIGLVLGIGMFAAIGFVPTFLLFSQFGLTNTPWAIILPSLISPFGMYLIWTYAVDAIPAELEESARIDGASEWKMFWRITVPLLRPILSLVMIITVIGSFMNTIGSVGISAPVSGAAVDRCVRRTHRAHRPSRG
ncbi:carbohydrate ABC transporter permease, partial [Bacillus sp. S34]|nr:carbohydrate ABC transporter permease [Bacillus sp. S34]